MIGKQLSSNYYRVAIINQSYGKEDNMSILTSTTIIGGSDGPTSIFLADQLGWNWINLFGFIIIVLMMIPNIVYAMKFRGVTNKCKNKWMNLLEQVGRYGCMFLMIFNIGIAEFGYASVEAFLLYLLINAVLMLAYWIIWVLYFHKQQQWKSLALAILPSCMFLFSGILLRHVLLVILAIVFTVSHIFVTIKNTQDSKIQ